MKQECGENIERDEGGAFELRVDAIDAAPLSQFNVAGHFENVDEFRR